MFSHHILKRFNISVLGFDQILLIEKPVFIINYSASQVMLKILITEGNGGNFNPSPVIFLTCLLTRMLLMWLLEVCTQQFSPKLGR